MNKISTLLKCSSLIALVGYLAIACVNHDYDFKNIDDVNTDITVGGSEFAIPIGSLDSIALNRFLSEGDFLTVNNGKYEISKNGSFSVDLPQIAIVPFTPDAPVLDEQTLDFTPIPHSATKVDQQHAPYMNAHFTANASFGEVDLNIVAPGIPSEVVSVKSLYFTSPSTVVLSFSLVGLPSAVRVAFDTYTIKMPDFMIFEDPILQSTRQLVLDNEQFSSSGSYTKSVSVVGLTFSNALTPSAFGQITINDKIDMQGDVMISGKNIDLGHLQRVTFVPEVSIGQINVARVTAKVDPKLRIDKLNFMLNDVPDFLRGEGTKLDLNSVAFAMNTSNSIDIEFDLGVDLVPYIGHTAMESQSVSQTGMVVQAHPFGSPQATTMTNIWLSNILSSTPMGYTPYLNPELPKLIETIPDLLEIQPVALADQSRFSTIDLARTYSMAIDYRLVAPLSLGQDFMISYTEVVEDVKSQISDYLGNASSIEILTSVLNDIPLQFTLTAKALDSNGSPLNSVQITMKEVHSSQPGLILSCDSRGQAVRSNVVFQLSETTKGALSQMDQVHLTFTGAATQIVAGQSLAPEQSLKVKMSAKISGGITIK